MRLTWSCMGDIFASHTFSIASHGVMRLRSRTFRVGAEGEEPKRIPEVPATDCWLDIFAWEVVSEGFALANLSFLWDASMPKNSSFVPRGL